jgi:hypothetical protein
MLEDFDEDQLAAILAAVERGFVPTFSAAPPERLESAVPTIVGAFVGAGMVLRAMGADPRRVQVATSTVRGRTLQPLIDRGLASVTEFQASAQGGAGGRAGEERVE